MSGLEQLLTGRTLVKRYRIEEVIGRGGFAAVYRATDERLGRPVAVKVITLPAPDPGAREQARARFQREARAAASLPHHPNVVAVHDFGTDPELRIDFLVMELLHGEDLATYLARTGRPEPEAALHILRQAAEGLAVGHRAGIVHRDVKPGNLFLARPHDGDPFRVCVLDFGIARIATDQELTRLTHDATPLSPAFASPEQLRGETRLTPASDVYSLGLVGYQLLTGQRPFPGERTATSGDAPGRRVRELAPDVPAGIEAVVERALAPSPAARFASAGALAEALDAATADATRPAPAPISAPPPMAADHTLVQPRREPSAYPPPPAPERRRRVPFFVWLLALAIAGAAAFAGVRVLAEQERRRGEEEGLFLPPGERAPASGALEDAPAAAAPGEAGGGEAPQVVGASPDPAPAAPEPGVPAAGVPTGPTGGAESAVVQPSPDPGAAPAPESPQAAAPAPAPSPAGPAPLDSAPAPPPPRLLGEPVERPAGGAVPAPPSP